MKILTETLTDASNTANIGTFTYSVDIATVLGASTAYVGLTGRDGAVTSTQTISNYTYAAVPEPATRAGGLGTVSLLGLGLRAGRGGLEASAGPFAGLDRLSGTRPGRRALCVPPTQAGWCRANSAMFHNG